MIYPYCHWNWRKFLTTQLIFESHIKDFGGKFRLRQSAKFHPHCEQTVLHKACILQLRLGFFFAIDLKIADLTYRDSGQTDLYVQMFEDFREVHGDRQTITLI